MAEMKLDVCDRQSQFIVSIIEAVATAAQRVNDKQGFQEATGH